MNDRMEQLYEEAVNSASAELHEWNKNWQPGKHTNFEYEKVLYKKFAKLIVKECLAECWYDATPKQIADNIRQIFGVE